MKKQTKAITIILSIISLLMLHSIAYSALSTTMNISGVGYARVESNIRITNFKINTTEQEAISQYEQFNKEQIQSEVILPNELSTITYDVEITNYGSDDLGIYQITGLPTELTYEITNYQMKTKLCEDTNKCNLGAKKTISIKIKYNSFVESNTSYKLNLLFEFKPLYKVTYQNITNNNFPSYIMQGETLNINIIEDFLPIVKVSGTTLNKSTYTYQNKNLIVNNIQGPVEISVSNVVGEYEYTENYQTFTAPKSGTYKIELWGASGNNNYNQFTKNNPSYGGYTSGEIQLTANEVLYIYVGGQKKLFNMSTQIGSTGGGGATDIRLVSGENWYDFSSLASRIMVAGGSGGSYYDSSAAAGGHAGGLMSTAVSHEKHPIYSATQTSGGKAGLKGTDGKFGIGGTNETNSYNTGGGGYFGGGSAPGSGGGSSFISGHNGCVAITEESTEDNIVQRNDSTGTVCTDGTTDITCSYHYSNKIFTNTTMIDGGGYVWTTEKAETSTGMPTYDGNSTMTGNEGNGYVKISLISTGTDVIDSSGNNKNGTSKNVSYSSEGAVFNGSSSYMEYPQDLDIEFPMTYAFKVKLNDIPNAVSYTNGVLFGDVQTKAGFGYRYVTGGYVLNIGGNNTKVVSSTGLEFGKFHTYHLVYNSLTNQTVYRDGIKLSKTNESNNWTWTGANSTIGKRIQGSNSSNSFLDGSIEYFMIYNKALTEDEIAINNQATNKSDFTTDELKLFYYFK